MLSLPVESLQQLWPRTRVHLGVQTCRSLACLLFQVSADGREDVPPILLRAGPRVFAEAEGASQATRCLRRLERPIDLVLAGSGRHCGAALRHALSNGFNPLLLRTLDVSRSCLPDKEIGTLCAAVRACTLLERLSLGECASVDCAIASRL